MEQKIKQELEEPTLVEVFNDDGSHSHWSLVDSENGVKLWSENPTECNVQGYPVECEKTPYKNNSIDLDKDFLISALNHYWNDAYCNLQRNDLGDIEKRNYEYQLKISKQEMNKLNK